MAAATCSTSSSALEKSDEQGIFCNNYSRRTGGRANFGFTPSEKLNFNMNVGYVRTHVRAPLSNNSSNSILRNGYPRSGRTRTYQYEVGYRNFGPTLANEWDVQTKGERYTIGLTANYNPFSWFSNRLVIGLDNQNRPDERLHGHRPDGQPALGYDAGPRGIPTSTSARSTTGRWTTRAPSTPTSTRP